MKLIQIENLDISGRSWKFQMKGKTYTLNSPGIKSDEKIYYNKANNSSFKLIGGGMLVENDKNKPHLILFNLDLKTYFIIEGDIFEQVMVSIRP